MRRPQFAAPANIREKVAPRLLGTIHRLQKQYGDAEQILTALLREFPTDHVSWFDLGLVYLDAIALEKFASVVRELLKHPAGVVDAGVLTALWYLRHGDPLPAGPIIDQLITDAPQRVHPRMLRCEWLSRCGAPLTEQSQALRDVLRINPSDTETTHWLTAIERAQGASLPVLGHPAGHSLETLLSLATTTV